MNTSNAILSRRCTTSAVGMYHCESFTNHNKSYDVVIDSQGRDTCTCVAFVMKRNKLGGLSAIGTPECTCKHIRALKSEKRGCEWTSDTGATPEIETVCPNCYADTEEFDTRDPATVDLDELMADFLVLQKKLKKARS